MTGDEMTREDAAQILADMGANRWTWLKVRRFDPTCYKSDADRYNALEQHHQAETSKMLAVIKDLCEALLSSEADFAEAGAALASEVWPQDDFSDWESTDK